MENRDPLQKFLVVFLLITGTLYFFWISWSSKAVNNQHIGDIKIFYVSAFTGIVGYYIGSSRGSRAKTDAINQMIIPRDGSTTITTKSPDPAAIDIRQAKEARVLVLETLATKTPEDVAELQRLRDELMA